ncbi:MAG: CmcJ/NvfI family oxidoreductase [Pseudomonadota bacterium]
MPQTASVNYHVHRPERQAFHIDAGGVEGRIIHPDYAVNTIDVFDARSETSVSFKDDSLGFFKTPSAVSDFENGDTWRENYDAELTAILKREIGATEVVIFDHTVRVDDPNANRKPARNVHSDYSPEGANRRLVDILGAERAAEWARGHFAFINVWRPVGSPINSAPLGFVRPSSVHDEDWIMIDLIYPDRKGHIMGLVANPEHEWIYRSKMTPDEIAVFNIFDNRGQAPIGHSAIDMVEDPALSRMRKSIESRTLVRY